MKTLYEEIYKLKDIVRRGWILAGVPKFRKESDAEHTFSMLILALELMAKNKLKLDELKVVKMIAYHELCEIDAGDITPYDDITVQERFEREYACIKRLAKTYNMPEIESIWFEFSEQKTPEAKFVKMIDKVDAIEQACAYAKEFNDKKISDSFNLSKEYYDMFKKLKR